MTTFQQVIDDARVLLNDESHAEGDTLRYTEAQLLNYAKQAVLEARRIRPDLFLFNLFSALPDYAATDSVPMPDEYRSCLGDYVAARAEMRDDEFTVDGRAAAMRQQFKAALLGIA